MPCKTSVYTYSGTRKSLFLEVFCGNSVQEYLVYIRRGRVYVQTFIRTPYPQFGKMIHEFYVCAECNYLYNSPQRPHTRNINTYIVQCVRKSDDVWSTMSSIDEFMNYINSNASDAENRVGYALKRYFGVLQVGENLDYCCEGKGPAIYLSCKNDSIVSYRRPTRSPPDQICLGDTIILYTASEGETRRVVPGVDCFPSI